MTVAKSSWALAAIALTMKWLEHMYIQFVHFTASIRMLLRSLLVPDSTCICLTIHSCCLIHVVLLLHEQDPYVRAVCMSPDSSRVVAVMENNHARILSLYQDGGAPVTLSGHVSELYSLDWVENLIASGSGDGQVNTMLYLHDTYRNCCQCMNFRVVSVAVQQPAPFSNVCQSVNIAVYHTCNTISSACSCALSTSHMSTFDLPASIVCDILVTHHDLIR
jgi:WD40 repeat protein